MHFLYLYLIPLLVVAALILIRATIRFFANMSGRWCSLLGRFQSGQGSRDRFPDPLRPADGPG